MCNFWVIWVFAKTIFPSWFKSNPEHPKPIQLGCENKLEIEGGLESRLPLAFSWSFCCQIGGKRVEKPKTKEQSLLQNESTSAGSAGGTHHPLPRHATAAVWEKDQSRVFPLKNFSSQNNNVLKYFTWKRGDKPVQTKTSSCFTFIKLFNPGP